MNGINTENREQRTENREQRTENREQRTENREQREFNCLNVSSQYDNIIFFGCLNGKTVQGYAYSVYGINGVCATITTGCGGGHIPLILCI